MTCVGQRPTRPQRRGLQYSLLALIVVVAAAAVLSRWWLYEPPKWDRVQIHIETDRVVVDKRKTSWNDLAKSLNASAKRIRESGVDSEGVIVRLTVDDEAVYADFVRVVEACRKAELPQIHVRPDENTDWFHMMPVDVLYWGFDLPPYTIELKADANGDLVRMMTPAFGLSFSTQTGRQAALDRLHKVTLQFVGPRTGRDSIREMGYFDLKCDDHLRFKHVAAVLLAMTEKPKGSGLRVPIVRKFLIPGGKELVEERLDEPLELQEGLDLQWTRDLFLRPSDPMPPIDVIPPAELANPSRRGGE